MAHARGPALSRVRRRKLARAQAGGTACGGGWEARCGMQMWAPSHVAWVGPQAEAFDRRVMVPVSSSLRVEQLFSEPKTCLSGRLTRQAGWPEAERCGKRVVSRLASRDDLVTTGDTRSSGAGAGRDFQWQAVGCSTLAYAWELPRQARGYAGEGGVVPLGSFRAGIKGRGTRLSGIIV